MASSSSKCDFNRDLYDAATKGDIKFFEKEDEPLNRIVTSIKNTILHIHITPQIDPPEINCPRQIWKRFPSALLVNAKAHITSPTDFVRQIVKRCSLLLVQVNANGDTPLHIAARYGLSDKVNALVEGAKEHNKSAKAQDVDLESGLGGECSNFEDIKQEMLRTRNNQGNSALHEAVRNNHIDVVRILTREDPDDSHFANNLGETPLFIAAEIGCVGTLTAILETCKSAAFMGPRGRTALHVAVRNKHIDVVNKLLEEKKSLTKETDEYGWTPLHFAAYYGSFDLTKLLLNTDTSAAYVADKERKMTALHMAVSQAVPFRMCFVVRHTFAYLNIISTILLRLPDCCEMVDNRGWNALHFAMAKLPVPFLKNLVQNPILRNHLTAKDAKGNTPLHVLAACRPTDYSEIMKNLIDQGYHYAFNPDVMLYRSSQLQQEIRDLSTPDAARPYEHGIIRRDQTWIFERLSILEKSKDSEMVIATLIATVTFTAALTMPGGYKSEEGPDQGTAFLSRKAAFQAFVITDTIAMAISLLAVYLEFLASWSLTEFWYYRLSARVLILVSIIAMVVAFSTGTYAVLPPSSSLGIVACAVGLSFFFVLFAIVALDRKWRKVILN